MTCTSGILPLPGPPSGAGSRWSRAPRRCRDHLAPRSAAGKEEARVTELVPRVAVGDRLVVGPLGQGGTGHRLDEEQVRGVGVVPAGDEAVDDARPATSPAVNGLAALAISALPGSRAKTVW